MCGNAPVVIEVLDPTILRSALAADANRPLHFRALIEIDQLHALLGPTRTLDAPGNVSLTTRLLREINPTEVS